MRIIAGEHRGRLLKTPDRLEILGDGLQSKSYIHVDDVLDALLLLHDSGWRGFDFFNVATEDYLTVREIAQIVVARLGLTNVNFVFAGGDRGWKGDVPVVRFDSSKIRRKGWANKRSTVQAMTDSIDSMIHDAKSGKF